MGATTLYFAQLSASWHDWVQIINTSDQPAKVIAIARNSQGEVVWTQEKTLPPFCAWTPVVDTVRGEASLQVSSDRPIVGERHVRSGTQVMAFPGASEFSKTVGRRLFFPEIVSGCIDWFRFFNVGDADAHVSVIVRNIAGKVTNQFHNVIRPLRWWDVDDRSVGNIQGTLEVRSTQPIVGERHLHYSGGQVAVGQLGQVIE